MNKKLLLVGALILSSVAVEAQTIFSENFNTTTSLPTGWVQHNVDGLTPASALATNGLVFGTNAWIPVASSSGGKFMASTSYYTPAGTSNDWLVTKSITIPSTGSYVLLFDEIAPDATYPDGFNVLISTTGQAVADFTNPPVLSVSAGDPSWTTKMVDLSSYSNQTIYVAIVNNSNDMDVLYVDNFIVYNPQPNDAVLSSTKVNNRYSAVSVNNTLTSEVKNNGSNAITSITLNWNDGTDHIQTIATNIPAHGSATVNHPTPLNYSTALDKLINVTITQVNNATDPVPGDNVGSTKFNTIANSPQRKVVFEEGTGTWCGFCVRGAVAMEYMHANHPDFIGIAVHNGDPMTVTEYDAGNAKTLSGFPGANIDRFILGSDVDNTTFEDAYNTRKVVPTAALVSATATTTGSSVSIVANATFATTYSNSELRFAVAIIEDSVQGTTSSYDQHNYYSNAQSGGSAGTLVDVHGLDYQLLPAVIPHATYKFNHVARAIVGGFTGLASSVPSVIAIGDNATHTFNYTIPSGSNPAYMRAAVLLIDNFTGEIVNAAEVDLTSHAGVNVISADEFNMNVYPNPSTDVVNVSFKANNADYSVSLTDLAGKVVVSNEYSNLNGTQSVQIPVNNVKAGSYLITVTSNNTTYTQHVVIK